MSPDGLGATLGQRIRRLREMIGLSQVDLVKRLEDFGVAVSQAYMSRVERNERVPGADVIAGLARVLGVTTDYLLDMDQAHDSLRESGDMIYSLEGRRTAFLMDNLSPGMRRFAMGLIEYVATYDEGKRKEEAGEAVKADEL